MQYVAKVTTRTELQDQEEFGFCLEGEVQANDEGMLRVGEHVTFGLCVSDEVVSEDLLLCQDFHGVEFA